MVRVAFALAVALVGCTIADLDYTGKTCGPAAACPSGYACDPITSTCGHAGETGSCPAAIVPTNFHAEWATPNTIRWAWEPAGDKTKFQRYELRTGKGYPETADVAHPDETWNADRNAELGKFELLHTQGSDPERATTTDGLDPSTPYWGVLLAYDSAGCASVSKVVGALTHDEPLPQNHYDIFVDALPGGAFLSPGDPDPPPFFEVSTDPSQCKDGSAACLVYDDCLGNVLHVLDLSFDLAALGDDLGKTAFWELSVAVEKPSYWSELYLGYGPPSAYARVTPYTISPSAGYRVIQIPFAHLKKDDGSGYLDTKPAGALTLEQMNVYGDWCGLVRMDDIRVRW